MNIRVDKKDRIHLFSLALLLGLVFPTYSNRMDDLDLWWHLKTCEVVLKDLSLPGHDIFSYTTGLAVPLTESELQGLEQYIKPSDFNHLGVNLVHSWLRQSLLYLAYRQRMPEGDGAEAGNPGILSSPGLGVSAAQGT